MPELVFIGPSGAGKSRIGRRVARALGLPIADTDKMVVAEYGPIVEIFERHGELRFRELERAAVQRALSAPGVVSLGGGAVLDPDTQRDLELLRVVLLTVSPESVEARLGDGKRPLVKNGVADWVELNAPRWEIYRRLADVEIDTSFRSDDEIAQEVTAWATSRA